MQIRRTAAAALVVVPLVVAGAGAGQVAHAHGTSRNPPSRIELCSTQGGENPENFRLSACRAAKDAVGGNPAPFYDPNAVNIANAGGRHRQLIPDGKLCSANRPQYAGLDLARADWPTTALPSGSAYTFRYRASAPHRGSFEYYITKDGFDVTKPLKWSDLEDKPFLTAKDPALQSGSYVMNATLPRKSGRHLIYVIWQRSDSQEAFYSCSDVTFGGTGGGTGGSGTTGGTTGGTSGGATGGTTGGTTGGMTGGGGGQAGGGAAGAGTSGGSAGGAGGATGGGDAGNGTAGNGTPGGTGGESATGGHAGHDAETPPAGTPASATASGGGSGTSSAQASGGTGDPAVVAGSSPEGSLAQTGGGSSTPMIAGGAAVLVLGGAALFWARHRRRAAA